MRVLSVIFDEIDRLEGIISRLDKFVSRKGLISDAASLKLAEKYKSLIEEAINMEAK